MKIHCQCQYIVNDTVIDIVIDSCLIAEQYIIQEQPEWKPMLVKLAVSFQPVCVSMTPWCEELQLNKRNEDESGI